MQREVWEERRDADPQKMRLYLQKILNFSIFFHIQRPCHVPNVRSIPGRGKYIMKNILVGGQAFWMEKNMNTLIYRQMYRSNALKTSQYADPEV